MKKIYISLPISGQEDTYEQRLATAVALVKEQLPEFQRIVTPKEIAMLLDNSTVIRNPEYKDYLFADLCTIAECHAVFMCNGWANSKGCLAEYHLAVATDKEIYLEQDFE